MSSLANTAQGKHSLQGQADSCLWESVRLAASLPSPLARPVCVARRGRASPNVWGKHFHLSHGPAWAGSPARSWDSSELGHQASHMGEPLEIPALFSTRCGRGTFVLHHRHRLTPVDPEGCQAAATGVNSMLPQRGPHNSVHLLPFPCKKRCLPPLNSCRAMVRSVGSGTGWSGFGTRLCCFRLLLLGLRLRCLKCEVITAGPSSQGREHALRWP